MWLEFGDLNEFAVEVETPSGEKRIVTVPARAREALASTSAAPIFELDWNERRHAIERGVGYLRPGPFYNNAPDATDMWDNAAFKTFIDTAFSDFIRAEVPAVLIDMRANPGGDNSFSDHMVAWFADRPFKFASHFYVRVSDATTASNRKRLTAGDTESITARFEAAYAKARNGEIIDFDLGESKPRDGERFRGKVYMLIDRHSYSNTVTVAALAQDYGLAKILGEETSDLATTYGAMENFALPETGIEVGYPKAHIIRPSGGLDARGVIPDIAIASPLRAPTDVMLQEAFDIVERAIRSGGAEN
jgi:C-terminal processing protease CtpA/Prc